MTWKNLPMAKIPSMEKESSFPGNATIEDGAGPWIGILLADRDVGFAPMQRDAQETVLAQHWDIGSDVLHQIHRTSREMSFKVFTDVDYA
jgi:hypothetical protein